MTEKDYQELHRRSRINSEQIREMWRGDAEKILERFVHGDTMVVVTGPGGSGKTVNLIPQMIEVGAEQGYTCKGVDCQALSGLDWSQLPISLKKRAGEVTGKQDVLLLDEADCLQDKDVLLAQLVEVVHNWGYIGIVALIREESPGDKMDEITRWIDSEIAHNGKPSSYRIEPKKLPPKLAEEFLLISGVERDQARYIVDNFPTYPRVLVQLQGLKTEQKIKDYWEDLVIRQKRGLGFGFSESDVIDTYKKLGI
ncbi:hypothetical protein A2Z22_04440 [Candidatus Woesebacteria bacterium RBG_16_34_12]|uniref:AAA+ ATPase domain-containing protein n=1 Tax=Candidatus Woesebacteria bacterium RBG_16_34_12 TaxID=1802480 RepID=A0A1F7X9T5_9BACT|nr:MAG: hypothetical protein A2Z22_04440 [Candidatus Woesebacteria bacterium RBG_16_34_12]